MSTSNTESAKLSTSQQLVKTGFSCLRRHQVTDEYYAVKKHRGKIKQFKLRTENGQAVKDRKLAEKILKEWIENLHKPEAEKPVSLTFAKLLEKHRAVRAGLSTSSKQNVEWAINTLKKTWNGGLDIPVDQIKASDLASWLALRAELKPASYNEISRQLKNIFELATSDGVIPRSPYEAIPNRRKKIKRAPDTIPGQKQFNEIVKSIRKQRFADHAHDSADLATFLGLAALGEAEAKNLCWKDVDFGSERIAIKRQKTGKYFHVPIYPALKPFLLNLHKSNGSPTGNEKVFKVSCCKKALATACKNLNYPHFSPRSLRKFGVTSLIRHGVNIKLVSQWQGHQDGGKLIMDTYSHVISNSDGNFERAELAKLKKRRTPVEVTVD